MRSLFPLSLLGALASAAPIALAPGDRPKSEEEGGELEEACALQVHMGRQEQAMAVGGARRVGKAIDIGAYRFNAQGEISPYINTAYLGMQGFGKMTLDTGSSELAFCPPPTSTPKKEHTDIAYCAPYEGLAWWGWVYNDSITVQMDDNGGVLDLGDAHYGIMEKQTGFCLEGSDGIFGIAFKGQDIVGTFGTSPLPTDSTPYNEYCTQGFKEEAFEMPPLLHYLNGQSGPEQLGIYWTGELGDSQGTLYLDDEARSNVHYTPAGTPMKARMQRIRYYDINVINITIGEFRFDITGTPWDCTTNMTEGPCILDTGTPGMELPEAIRDTFVEYTERGYTDVSVLIELEGAPGFPNPVLKFTVGQLNRLFMWGSGPAVLSGGPKNLILGWVVWAFYYIVFDITDGTVEFVRKPDCAVGDHVVCPGESGRMCSGSQCCPRDAASGNRTFTCPSAPAGEQGCEAQHKVVNCIDPVIRPFTS